MSEFFKFASVAHPQKYGYAFDRSVWSVKSTETNQYFRQFETYGDGLTQHSGDWNVTFDFLTDYLASLAVAMMANDELARTAAYSLRHDTTADRIAFAASVVWRESDRSWEKRRYYSMTLLKMGTRTKEHDKRFEEIRDSADGSRASIFRLVNTSYASMFDSFQMAEAVKSWADAQPKYVQIGEGFPEFFGGDYAKNSQLRSALQCCRYVVEAVERREWAQGSIDNYAARIAREAERALDDAAAAAAHSEVA